MTGTMILVDRAKLLSELRAARQRQITEHEKAVEAYPSAIEKWNTDTAAALHKIADRLNGRAVAGFEKAYHGQLVVPIARPEMPRRPKLDTCRVDRYIRIVELTTADTYKLRTDDPLFSIALPDRC